MESKTKLDLPQAEIRRLVRQAFGQSPIAAVRELSDGWFNTAYQVTFANNNAPAVLKVGSPPKADILSYEKNIMRAEVETMKLVASNPSIPVPRVIFADFSRTSLPYDYFFMDLVLGTPWDKIRNHLTAEQNSAIEYQLGQITAHINAFRGPAFGYYAAARQFDNWPAAFQWMCKLLFADARHYQVPLELSERDYFESFEQHRHIFEEVRRPQLVHWDLWAGNIFIDSEGERPKIVGIIDFERALWGDPLMESYLSRMHELTHFMAGYGQNILRTRTQRLRRLFYNIYLHLVMIIEDGPRQYSDKGSVQQARERLREDMKLLHFSDSII